MYEYQADIIRVIDGDTVVASIDLGIFTYRRETLRLYGINTSELNSKDPAERVKAIAAKNFLKENIEGKRVFIKTHKDGFDKYGRFLATIYPLVIGGDGALSYNQTLVDNGLAVPYYP